MMDPPAIPLEGDRSPDRPAVADLPRHEVPLVRATPVTLARYAVLVDDPDAFPVELVPWPALGWRPVDPDTGLGGGLVSTRLDVRREGDLVLAREDEDRAEDRVIGWAARVGEGVPAVLLRAASYQPDGARLIVPLDPGPYVVVLAMPGDDVAAGDFVGFLVESGRALSIAPGVWCGADAAYPAADADRDHGRFLVRRGRVRARISCDLAEEFGVVLAVPLRPPIP
ncbi:ureidoglycolate hydrolase [Aquisphaera insulae]|uniref:ureidoglycolate hydrolase n=1 Tax=Aquisphaera insulae TaxID=2712864 RepID=UPI0013EC0221|nr:ureidoglycolate hydrolase [Aquisphaera insulae]